MQQKKLVAAEAPYLATQSAKMATKVVWRRHMVRKVLCTRFPGKPERVSSDFARRAAACAPVYGCACAAAKQ